MEKYVVIRTDNEDINVVAYEEHIGDAFDIMMENFLEYMNEVQKKTAYEFGNRYLGPFLTAFACWLEDNVQADKISRLFFLSRDGYMMKKAYEGIFPYCNVECRYVYFSRKSLIRAGPITQ